MTTTQSPSELKELNNRITDQWRVLRKHLEHLPQTIEDWQEIYADFDASSGRDPFMCELAVTFIREIQRRAGEKVTTDRGWLNG